jgi:peptidyl-prolyl cis-trans isomerase C
MTTARLVGFTLLSSVALAHTPTSFERAALHQAWLVAPERARADAPPADAATPDPAEVARRAQVVAKGTGIQVTLGDLEDHLNKMPPALRARYLAPEERKTLLATFVRNELFALEAQQRGFANNPAVRQTVKDGAVQSLVRTEVDEKTTPQSISKDQISAYYAANPAEFHHPAERRASHILLATREQAEALLAEAKAADARAFGDLARRHSLDGETKLRGGDLAFFAREPVPTEGRKVSPALRKAVFELKATGDTTDKPVEVEGQYSIVRLTGERPERNVSLAEAENTIRSKLWREGRQKSITELLDKLRAKDKPKVFSERVDLVSFDDMEKRPAGFAPDPPGPISPRAGSPSAPAAGSKAP